MGVRAIRLKWVEHRLARAVSRRRPGLVLERGAGLRYECVEVAPAGEARTLRQIKNVLQENYHRIAALLREAGTAG